MWPHCDPTDIGRAGRKRPRNSLVPVLAIMASGLAALVGSSSLARDIAGDVYVDKRPLEIVSWRKSVTLQLEDGGQHTVLLRRTPPVITAGTESIAAEYHQLRAAAEAGNANAAYALYKALHMCSIAPRNEEELDRAIELLHTQRHVRVLRPPYIAVIPPGAELDGIESGLRQVTERCTGVTSQQISESKEWLDAALKGGVPWAFKAIAQSMPDESLYTLDGLRAWTAVWRTGSVAALSWIAKIHRHGVHDAAVPAPDPVRAYAHQFLYVRLMRESAAASGGQVANLVASRLEDDLSGWADSLTSADRQRAARIAREVLAANESCCYLD